MEIPKFLCVVVPMPPPQNHSLIPVKRGKTTRMVNSPELRMWYSITHNILASYHGLFTAYPGVEVGVFIEAFFKSQRRDIDSVTKKCLDVMQNHIYTNDRQVKFQAVAPQYGDWEKEECVMWIWPIHAMPEHVKSIMLGYV